VSVEQAEQIRARVLAAAQECLLEGGFGASRLHSSIARRAGLSRPTVYKYAGDQDSIISALILREVGTLLAQLEPLMDRELPFTEQLVNVMAYVTWFSTPGNTACYRPRCETRRNSCCRGSPPTPTC
jgi:AcrR family transcriptional regulator